MGIFNVLQYGAKADGISNDGPAIQRAIDACTESGGGTVVVPAGKTFLSGSIMLKSRVNLHLEPGSRVMASLKEEDYANKILLESRRAQDISLTGTGCLDGRARDFRWEELPHIYRCRPWLRMVGFTGCRGVVVRDVTLRDSSFWGMHLTGCENVVVHGVTILNDLKQPNCDGIDPDRCRNVRISDCHIEAGDDCICLKSSPEFADYGVTENITVTGCTLISTSCAIKIGSATVGDIRDVVFDACVIKASNRGLGVQHRDGGNVENILFSNIIVETRLFHDIWWGKAEPIYVTAFNRTPGAPLGRLRNIRFSNILARSENGAYISGCPDCVPEGILLENVRVEINKWSKYPGGFYDRRPCATEGIILHRNAGFLVNDARDVVLRNCRVDWGENRPEYYGHALESHRVQDLVVENFRGEAAHPERDAAQLID